LFGTETTKLEILRVTFLVLLRKIMLERQASPLSSVLTAFVWGFSFTKGKDLAERGKSDGSARKQQQQQQQTRFLHKICNGK